MDITKPLDLEELLEVVKSIAVVKLLHKARA
jgi:hypothetical protein